jgi:serine/threonine-protein kinase
MARPPAIPEIPANLPQKGEVIAGKYLIEDVLGAGGMGIVVAARHIGLNQRVAIKLLLHASVQVPEAAERLIREARAISSIRSEHVARVHDVGRLDTGSPYMVMEYLGGTHLGRLIRARTRLPVIDAVDCILQAGEAIAEAHALGIVHRDLKPSNLYVVALPDRSLCIKVLDFGLSKVNVGDGKQLTETGVVAGSPQYMSPEQMQSLKHVDHRADIWSLGVILYYAIAGKRPFEGNTIPAVWASIVSAPVASLQPQAPPALDALIQRCFEKDPNKRVQNMAELAQGLAPFGSSRGARSVAWIMSALSGAPRHLG